MRRAAGMPIPPSAIPQPQIASHLLGPPETRMTTSASVNSAVPTNRTGTAGVSSGCNSRYSGIGATVAPGSGGRLVSFQVTRRLPEEARLSAYPLQREEASGG